MKLLEKVGEEQGKGNVEGVEVEAETYVWVAGEGKLEEGEWDFEVFRREKMGRWVGVADEYSGEWRRRSFLGLSAPVSADVGGGGALKVCLRG